MRCNLILNNALTHAHRFKFLYHSGRTSFLYSNKCLKLLNDTFINYIFLDNLQGLKYLNLEPSL